MRKINLLLCSLVGGLLFSCAPSDSDCQFKKLTIAVAIDGTETQKKDGSDCYLVTKEDDGMLVKYTIEGKQTSEVFSVFYFDEFDKIQMPQGEATVLRFLDVNVNGNKNQWRANKGHKIFKIEKQDTLAFMFSDGAKGGNAVSGTILFTK